MTISSPISRGRIGEVALYFLRLGLLGFGGPVALVGQMERELVADRKWLTKEQMREAIAVCQSLPGPLAIQVGIYVSYLRVGFWGAWAGGWAFILPNFVIVAALGALYVHLGDLPAVTAVFYGVSPAVIALILHSCYRLAKLGMEDRLQWALAVACLVVTVILRAEVALLFIGAGIVGILYYGSLFRRLPPAAAPALAAPILAQLAPVASGSTLGKLLLFFLKAGSLTFGSGLVIVPFLQKGLVQEYGWLDERQFLIAVAIGMISPGPVEWQASGAPSSQRSESSSRHSFSCSWQHRFSRAIAAIRMFRVSSREPMRPQSGPFSAPASCSGELQSAIGLPWPLVSPLSPFCSDGRSAIRCSSPRLLWSA
jgi:chromate transporter